MDFYFYEGVKASIEGKSYMTDKSTGERLRHWPLLVRLALVEIYGKRLADHSAKGSKSGSRPAIDHRLYRAVHCKFSRSPSLPLRRLHKTAFTLVRANSNNVDDYILTISDWASDWVGHEVDVDAYVDHINKTCYNKRKAMPRVINKQVKKPAKSDNTEKDNNAAAAAAASSSVSVQQPNTTEQTEDTLASNSINCYQTSVSLNSIWDSAECKFSNLM